MTTVTIVETPVIILIGLVADIFSSCSLQSPPLPTLPPEEEIIYLPVAPGVTYESLPEIVFVDTSPGQIIGCINEGGSDPQGRLNVLFPAAISGDGVIEQLSNDIWVYDGTTWNNVGSTPGLTVVSPPTTIPPYNETWTQYARIRVNSSVIGLNYSLNLSTEIDALKVSINAIIARAELLASDVGALTLSGKDSQLKRSYDLVATPAAFTFVGLNSGYVWTRYIGANNGSYISTGFDALLIALPRIFAESGAFAVNGNTASLSYQRLPMPADAGSYELLGQNVDLSFINYRLDAAAESFAFSGVTAELLRGYVMPANTSSFVGIGQAASLVYARSLTSLVYYTGNGDTQSISSVGFAPGFVALKRRDFAIGTFVHGWFDIVRGAGRYIQPGRGAAEVNNSISLTAFTEDGFSLSFADAFNKSGSGGVDSQYLAWSLPKGAAASSNTNGTLASTVSYNSDVEYSIVTWTGDAATSRTIGHGLSGVPDLVLVKRRADAASVIYAGGAFVGNDKYITFGTSSVITSTTAFSSFESSTFTVGSTFLASAATYVAYAMKIKEGIGDVGTYQGNGTDLFSKNLGYTPKFVIAKNLHTDSTQGEADIFYRPTGGTGYATFLRFSSNAQEQTSTKVQFTSTGFSVDSGGVGNSGTQAFFWAMK